MDTVSERLVQEAVGRLVKGRTVVVIAHRLSTVQVGEVSEDPSGPLQGCCESRHDTCYFKNAYI